MRYVKEGQKKAGGGGTEWERRERERGTRRSWYEGKKAIVCLEEK